MIAKTTRHIKKVAIFGDAQAQESDEHFQTAYQVARLLALSGYTIINGGGPGVMLAATLGAESVNGTTEVAVVDKNIDMGKNYEGTDLRNISKVDKIITQNNYPDRLQRLIKEADAFVICKGGTGTISELGEVWVEAKFNFGKHKPIVFLGGFWKKIMNDMSEVLALDKEENSVYEVADTPEEVVELIKNCVQV